MVKPFLKPDSMLDFMRVEWNILKNVKYYLQVRCTVIFRMQCPKPGKDKVELTHTSAWQWVDLFWRRIDDIQGGVWKQLFIYAKFNKIQILPKWFFLSLFIWFWGEGTPLKYISIIATLTRCGKRWERKTVLNYKIRMTPSIWLNLDGKIHLYVYLHFLWRKGLG